MTAAEVKARADEILDAMPEDGRPADERIEDAIRIALANLKAERFWGENSNQPPADSTAERGSGLRFFDLSDLRRRVEAQSAEFLIDELWPEDAYGVMGAEDKAGKTWSILDLSVSIASDTPWLGRYDVKQGSVLVLFGEGGARNLIRRLDAICRGRDLDLEELGDRLRISLAVPRLDNTAHLDAVRAELDRLSPRAVLLDPLYLAAAAGKGRDLYAMGESLQAIQALCQDAAAALAVNTHWNKTGEGRGPARFTGVGPGAWGRVLGSAEVEQRHTDPDGCSTATLLWEFTGGEIADTRFRMQRRVWVDDPHDLGSAMHYECDVTDEGAAATPSALTTAQDRVLAVLKAGGTTTVQEIGDELAKDGRGYALKKRTIQQALKDLSGFDLADGETEEGKVGRWWAT